MKYTKALLVRFNHYGSRRSFRRYDRQGQDDGGKMTCSSSCPVRLVCALDSVSYDLRFSVGSVEVNRIT
jgi:hypothetical protein